MIEFTRGTTVHFKTAFRDADGNDANPESASVVVSYPLDGWPLYNGTRTVTLEMVQNDDGTWEATWDCSVSASGHVEYHIRASDPSLATEDGKLRVIGNRANPISS